MKELSLPVICREVDLTPYNTFGVEATAARWFRFSREEELYRLGRDDAADLLVLGEGSNILFLDRVPSLVAKNEIRFIQKAEESAHEVIVEAGGGTNWQELVSWCVERGLGGIENLALIPGTAGAAPIQNIGAYGVELSHLFHSLRAFDLHRSEMRTFLPEECGFGYRESVFKSVFRKRYVIVSLKLRLRKAPHTIRDGYHALREWLEKRGIGRPAISDIYRGVIDIRRSKLPDPAELGNAGSFFKNPVIPLRQWKKLKESWPGIPSFSAGPAEVKVPAAWLIEHAGWRGRRLGNTGTHRDQALVIVNYGGASGLEIFRFSEQVRMAVLEKFGISLEREVNVEGMAADE